MKFNFLFIPGLIFLSLYVGLAQKKDEEEKNRIEDTYLQTLHSIDASILPLSIGYTYEQRLSNKFTLLLRPYVGIAAISSDGGLPILWNVGINVDGRWYYNMAKRVAQKKSIALNSGGFLGLALRYTHLFSEKTSGNLMILPGIYWGNRSHLGQNFYFEFDVGVGYYNRINYNLPYYNVNVSYKTSDDYTFSVFVDLKFSYVFSHTQKDEDPEGKENNYFD